MILDLLPLYQSHKKEVRAAKILFMEPNSIPSTVVGPLLKLENPAGGEPWLHSVSPAWAERFKPEVGGYFVVYDDGYTSFSPAKAFDEGYTRL